MACSKSSDLRFTPLFHDSLFFLFVRALKQFVQHYCAHKKPNCVRALCIAHRLFCEQTLSKMSEQDSQDGAFVCIICRDSCGTIERFCSCSGGSVHTTCLQRWCESIARAPTDPHPLVTSSVASANDVNSAAHSLIWTRRALAHRLGWLANAPTDCECEESGGRNERLLHCTLLCVHCRKPLESVRRAKKVDLQSRCALWSSIATAACRTLGFHFLLITYGCLVASLPVFSRVPLPWIYILVQLGRCFLYEPLARALAPPFAHVFDIQKPCSDREPLCRQEWQTAIIDSLLPVDAGVFPELALWSEYQRVHEPPFTVQCSRTSAVHKQTYDWTPVMPFQLDLAGFVALEFWHAAVKGDTSAFATNRNALMLYCMLLSAWSLVDFSRYVFYRILFTKWCIPAICVNQDHKKVALLHIVVCPIQKSARV